MKILLIEPPRVSKFGNLRTLGSIGTYKADMAWPPLELMIISGFLEKNGFSSTIIDANAKDIKFDNLRDIIKNQKPRMIVFTTSTPTIYNDLLLAKLAKEISQDILTVAIGTHIMALPEETLREAVYLDVAIYGESELPILEMVRKRFNLSEVLGICYRDPNTGQIKKNPPQAIIEDLDEFGFPSHNKLELNLYRDPLMLRKPLTITYGQRGCINSCIYCSSPFYTRMRKRSIDSIIQELRWVKDLGIKEVRFFDCGLTNDLDWAKQLCDKMIVSDIGLSWTCNARVDRLPNNLLAKIKEAGCHTLSIGVESSDQKILEDIGKNITIEMVKKVVLDAKRFGFRIMLYFMFGLPGETPQTIKKTIGFAKSQDVDFVTFGIATPHPKTEFYEYLERNGYLITRDWSKYDPIKEPVYEYPGLPSREIFKASQRAYRKYYLMSHYILRKIFSLHSFGELYNLIRNFFAFLKRYLIKDW